MIKKLFLTTLCAVLVASSLVLNSAAVKSYAIPNKSINRITEAFRNTVGNGTNYADLSDLNISMNIFSDKELADFIILLESTRASCGCVSFGKYSETYANYELDTDGDLLKGIKITYDEAFRNDDGTLNAGKLAFNKTAVSTGYSNALSVVKSNMSDIEKALVLYDYIITNVDYPDAYGKDENGESRYRDTAYTVTGFFAERKAVCSSYAKVYALLLNDAGIPAVTVYSDEINHEWVMLKLDGEWYHADPTWDDLRYENYTAYFDPNDTNWDEGAVKHFYFLKSDNEMRTDHISWKLSNIVNPEKLSSPPKAQADMNFSGRFYCQDFISDNSWFTYSKMNYINGYWYFADAMSGNLVSLMIDDDNPSFISFENDISYGKYAFGYGNYVFISTDYEVYRYDTMSGLMERVIALPDDTPNSYFSKMYIVDDTLYLTMYTLKGDNHSECIFNTSQYSLETLITAPTVARSNSIGLSFEADYSDLEREENESESNEDETIIEELSPSYNDNADKDNFINDEYETNDELINTIISIAAISLSVIVGLIIAKSILNSRKER